MGTNISFIQSLSLSVYYQELYQGLEPQPGTNQFRSLWTRMCGFSLLVEIYPGAGSPGKGVSGEPQIRTRCCFMSNDSGCKKLARSREGGAGRSCWRAEMQLWVLTFNSRKQGVADRAFGDRMDRKRSCSVLSQGFWFLRPCFSWLVCLSHS